MLTCVTIEVYGEKVYIGSYHVQSDLIQASNLLSI